MGHGLNYDRAPLSLVSSLFVASSPETLFLFRLFTEYIARERRCFSGLHDSAITMRYEIDIVTNVMEPSTIFRD